VPNDEFEKFYKSSFSNTFMFFLNKGFNAPDAQDLTQDVFLRVYKSWGTFKVPPEVWARTVADSVWKNKIRSIKTGKRDGQTTTIDHLPELSSERNNPERETELAELIKAMDKAITGLPHTLRITVELRIRRGLKYREIAELMGVTIDTVKARLHRATSLLKKSLGNEE